MIMLVHAPAIIVHRVLTDYAHIYRMNPSITESEILPSPDNETVRVRTRIEGCVFFFCKDIDRVEDVREVSPGHLQAVIVPAHSDFTSGQADWRIHPVGEDSQVVYQAEITPAFFIPPVIGDYFVKRTIAREVVTSFAKLECIARIKAGLDTRSRQYLADAYVRRKGCRCHSGGDADRRGSLNPGTGHGFRWKLRSGCSGMSRNL